MENTQEFYNNLIKFYETAPANDHTLELIKQNLQECRKREVKLNERISKLEFESEQQEKLFDIQFSQALSEAKYYRRQYRFTEELLKATNFNVARAERIDKRNEGLRKQCREYKQRLEELKDELRVAKNQLHPEAMIDGLELMYREQFIEEDELTVGQVLKHIQDIKKEYSEEAPNE